MKKRCLIYTLALSLLLSPSANAKIKPPSLNKKKITLKIGQTYTLKVKNKGKKTVKWSSTKKKTVSVNKKGVVSAKRKGKAKILAKIGRKTLNCKVTVKKSVTNHTQTNHSASSPKPGSNKITTPAPAGNKAKATKTPKPNGKPNTTKTPRPTQTPKPDNNNNTKTTPDPNSIMNKPTEDPKTKDDGWVPGWY
ncbi:MAG: hypothetical protein HFH14_11170 [Lachnospiraceae bacterium]|nr:hypothetical protein [Lachnospiraceae bacterium]